MPLTQDKKYHLAECIRNMGEIKRDFYTRAVHCGIHPFVEFAGLQAQFIEMCKDDLDAGIDFIACGAVFVHENKVHQMMYIAEKLNCIFGDAIAQLDEDQEHMFFEIMKKGKE